MFVARRAGGELYGCWTVRQWAGQEELSDDHAEVVAFLVPKPRNLRLIPGYITLLTASAIGVSGPFGPNGQWNWIGPVTTHMRRFFFEWGMCEAAWAHIIVAWRPNNIASRLRLLACDYVDNGVSVNPIVLGLLIGDGAQNPVPQGHDFTVQYNELVAARRNQYIGFEVMHNESAPIIYSVALEFAWKS